MIAAKCFTKAWLDDCRERVGRVDPGLLEKSIYAFELVGRLAAQRLPFVFKGGTAMLLLLDDFRRLSIDVDIVCPLSKDDVAVIVAEAIRNSPFTSLVSDERDPARLPKRHHYAIGFPSAINVGAPATLQLDVLEDEHHYPQTLNRPLTSRFIISEQDVRIPLPTIEGLLADKLTAFAPGTIGVSYNAFKAGIRIVKQMADIGELFRHARDGVGLAESYRRIHAAENGYRGGCFSVAETLDDTIDTGLLLSSIDLKGYVPSPAGKILANGIKQVDSHMIGRPYSRDDARISAARAAHLAALLRCDGPPEDLKMLAYNESAADATGQELPDGRFAIMNRLRGINPEAFHHWSSVRTVLKSARCAS